METKAPRAPLVRLPRSSGEFIYALAVAGMLAGMVISLPLWLTNRTFPHLPCGAWFVPWSAPWDAVLLAASVLLMTASAIRPDARRIAWGALAMMALLALQDQIRWQPWVWQYSAVMLLASLAGNRNAPAFLLSCRIMIVCMYAWSGLHKCTAAYERMYEATFTGPLTGHWPQWAVEIVRRAGPVSPWLEIAAAAALCWPRTRRAGVVAALVIHLSILILTGPAGADINAVVWPWNLVMPAAVVILFWPPGESGWRKLQTARAVMVATFALLLFAVLPAFSIPEKWDRYFSFQLYAGTERRLVLIIDAGDAEALPAEWQRQLKPSAREPSKKELHLLLCGVAELHVPPPSDSRHLLAIARECAARDFATRANLIFYTDFTFQQERGWDAFTAEEIRRMRTIPALRYKF